MSAKILLVEDEPSISMLLRDDLALEGYEVTVAADGEEGLRLALEGSPDVVVLDLMLPKKSGFEVCRQIKAQRKHLPVILLTAKGQESDKIAGFDMGADDYITKPFSVLELLARIKVALRHHQAIHENAHTGKRVAAIVMTDIVGYTQKAAVVPQGELMELMKGHHTVLGDVAKRHRGRLLNTVADSSALLFDSVAEAVDAALDIQRAHRTMNQRESNPQRHIWLHVGVHVGDLMLGTQGHEVYGDAINVAARVAKLGDHDVVSITEAARLALPHAREGLMDAGAHTLKGVEAPVRVFQVRI